MKVFATMALVVVAVAALSGCSKDDESARIKKIITTVQTAAEQKNTKAILEHLSKSYRDPQGLNYEGVRGLLAGYFFRYPKISVYLNALAISIDGDSAQARFQAVLTSAEKTGSITDAIPDSLGVWNFDVSLRKETGQWKILSARWEEADLLTPPE